jgi:hypothetical protein
LSLKAGRLDWQWSFRSLLEAFRLEIFLDPARSKIQECAREGCNRLFRYRSGKKYCGDDCRQLAKQSGSGKRTDYQRMYGRLRRGKITQEEFERWKEVQNG